MLKNPMQNKVIERNIIYQNYDYENWICVTIKTYICG